ncbi:prepilin-type N-terminal cleavage/methylation domain-containing protein [Acinetobacter sp. YH16032]|nr:prepilin-type N-terminal cleavage/methylation domain-containing protein [Acinetobacter sp. YH16032]
MRAAQQGVGMIEILVALLVLAIGVLGLITANRNLPISILLYTNE